MNEYLVSFRVTIPGFFSNKTFDEGRVYEAKSAKEAIELAQQDIKKELQSKGIYSWDLEDNHISINITDVKKI